MQEWVNEWMNELYLANKTLVILSLPSTPSPDSSPGDLGHSTVKGVMLGAGRETPVVSRRQKAGGGGDDLGWPLGSWITKLDGQQSHSLN